MPADTDINVGGIFDITSPRRHDREYIPSMKSRRDADNIDVRISDGLTSVCQSLMFKAGLVLQSNEPPLLRVDQAVFQRDLTTIMKNHSSYPQIVEEFVESFGDYIDDTHKLFWCLSSTSTDQMCDSARSLHQDAVIRILLNILDVQPLLMKLLLDKLLELSVDETFLTNSGELKNIPRMILYQIRRLDIVVDSSTLCERLLDITSVAAVDVRKEIIACIPEVLDDKDHERVAIAWSELLKQKTEFTPFILDSMTILCISSDVQEEVQDSVLESLDVVQVDMFPVVVKFLLQSVTPKNAMEILGEIRLTLDFSTQASVSCKNDAAQSHEVLTLQVITTAVRFQKIVGDTLVKILDSSKMQKDQRLLDLFLLFVLVDFKIYRKAVENVIINKIRNGSIDEKLIKNAFGKHKMVCQEHFKSVLLIADMLFVSSDGAIRKFGGLFMLVSFTELDNHSMLREVIDAVITHVRSENKAEVEIALDTIKEIVGSQSQKVTPFSVFLKGLLYRLERLCLSHIRKIYEILNLLGQSSDTDNHGILSDIHIIVRKQLSNPNRRYRRMGVIGALSTLRRTSTGLESGFSAEQLSNAKSLLTMIENHVAKDFEAKALFYEELSSSVDHGELDQAIVTWLTEYVTNDFQEQFVFDMEENITGVDKIKGQFMYGEDAVDESNISINLLKLACDDEMFIGSSALAKRSRLPIVAPQFRLMSICERVTHDGDLNGIDALLGCPLYIFHSDILCNFESKPVMHRKIVCRCLLAVINWFIELINAFVSQKNKEEIILKVIIRLRQIVQLRLQLEVCLKSTPSFIPSAAHYDIDDIDKPVIPAIPKPKSLSHKEKRGVKRKASLPSTSTQTEAQGDAPLSLDSTSVSSIPDELVARSNKSVDLNAYSIFFRELDMDVFNILRRDVIMKLDFEDNSPPKLGLRELLFLLNDLHSKLDNIFEQQSKSKLPFLSKAKMAGSLCIHGHMKLLPITNILKVVVRLLKSLRVHLENIGAFLLEEKARDDDNDVCNNETDDNAFLLAVECFRLVFACCTILFNWKDFDIFDNQHILCKSLMRFSENTTESTNSSLTQCALSAFEYFDQFKSVAPDFVSAVELVKLLDAIALRSPRKILDSRLAETCQDILKRDWNVTSEEWKTPKFTSRLNSLLKTYFKAHDNILDLLEMLTTDVVPDFIISIGRTNCSEKLPTFNKTTFPVYYEMMFKQLIGYFRNISSINEEKSDGDKLVSWSIGVRIFNILAMLLKDFSAQKIMAICLKHGRIFLELFVRLGMPIMDRIFPTHESDVMSVLKTVQQSTRFLHNVCSQSKVKKNVGLTSSVPLLRKTLEMLIFRVKTMVTVNNCKEAFWLGNLKNRNLQGEEILSQQSHCVSDVDSYDVENPVDDENDSNEDRSSDDESERSDDARNVSDSY